MRISESMRKGTIGPLVTRETGSERDDAQDVDAGVSREERRRRKDKALYQRFLRGENISDDDDDHVEDTEGTLSEDDEIADSDDDQIDDDERQAEAITLFADLLQDRSINGEDTSPGEMVLAHLAHGGRLSTTGPLTRRGVECSLPARRSGWSTKVRKRGHPTAMTRGRARSATPG